MSVLRPNPIFFPLSLPTTKPPLSSSSYSTKTLTLTLNLAGNLTTNPDHHHYGPSLRRLQPPLPPTPNPSSNLDPSSFSRTFIIPALRIPSSACSSLEHRLRGHLLNWPRIRNVARVPGDDLDPQIQTLLRNYASSEVDDRMDVMSPVLYREKLVKDFNCRGYLRFRNLAKMSRPKKRRRREGGGGRDGEAEKVYVVSEVLRESGDDLRGLIGDEFCGGRWRGPTRLLLLDERYKDKRLEELPEAVKV